MGKGENKVIVLVSHKHKYKSILGAKKASERTSKHSQNVNKQQQQKNQHHFDRNKINREGKHTGKKRRTRKQ